MPLPRGAGRLHDADDAAAAAVIAAAATDGEARSSTSTRPRARIRRPGPLGWRGDRRPVLLVGQPWRRLRLLPGAAFLLLLLLASLSVRPAAANLYSIGDDDVSGSKQPVDNLGKTEGCFSKFEPLLSRTYPAVELDNRVCQAWCASQRFSVSATALSTCYCSNDYPSAFFRVKDDICDNPCSPDKSYCFVNSCCGSRDGRHFTVAFAGQIDPVLQLLRQLTYDYRTNNPKLRDRVKALMGASAPLQVMSSGGLHTGVVMSGGAGLGLQGSCPEHYAEYNGECYRRVFGQMMSYAQAEALCGQDGASLAVVRSQAENDYLAQLLYQKSGWIGISNRDLGSFQWDDWTNWAPGEPGAKGAFLVRTAVAGAANGDAFSDQNADVRNIRQLAIYTSASRVVGIQAKYLMSNGTEAIGNVLGTNKGASIATAVISLRPGEYISGGFGEVVNSNLQTLNLVVRDFKGNSVTYGPYGASGGSAAKPWAASATGLVTGFFGAGTPQGINQLGFHDLQAPRCTQITPSGLWRVVPCAQAFDGIAYACQLRPTASLVDCPSGGWFRYGGLCYKTFAGNKLSWEAARAACLTMQATLATVTTPELNAFLRSRFQGAFGFVGLKDRMPMGIPGNRSFVWESYANWAPGQPAPLPSSKAAGTSGGGCVAMDASHLWSVVDCGDTSGARTTVCELAPTDNQCACPSGWTAFGCRCYQVIAATSATASTGVFGAGVSWLTAAQACSNLGGFLLDINSPGESSFVATRLAKGQGVFLGRRDVFNAGVYLGETYTNWAQGEPVDNLGTVNGGGGGLCGVIRGDGKWYGFPCTSAFSQAACKRPKAAPVGGAQAQGEEFTMVAVDPGVAPRWGQPLDVYLQHTATGAYLGVDGLGNLFTSTARGAEAQLQVASVANTTGFTVKAKAYDFYLRLDPEEGRLTTIDGSGSTFRRYLRDRDAWVVARRRRQRQLEVEEEEEEEEEEEDLEEEEEEEEEEDEGVFGNRRRHRRRQRRRSRRRKVAAAATTPAPTTAWVEEEAPGPSVFTTMKAFGPFSLQNLQIGVAVQKSQSMPYPRYCSLKIYDLTATSDSFSCYIVEGDMAGLPMVDLDVEAFTIQDKTSIMNPRTPLQNGRTKCENQSPTDTLTCTFAYGEGLTFSKALAVTWGQNYANQFQVERSFSDTSSMWYNYLYAFDNQYTSITTNTYVESRNWAVNVPVPPLTVCTMQFWLSSVDVKYLWQSILKATGGFELSANGVYFGSNYALSDISNPWDLHVYQWGRYTAPSQAEVIITTDEIQAAKYQLQVPSMSNMDYP